MAVSFPTSFPIDWVEEVPGSWFSDPLPSFINTELSLQRSKPGCPLQVHLDGLHMYIPLHSILLSLTQSHQELKGSLTIRKAHAAKERRDQKHYIWQEIFNLFTLSAPFLQALCLSSKLSWLSTPHRGRWWFWMHWLCWCPPVDTGPCLFAI